MINYLLISHHGASPLKHLHQIKTPQALAVFGAFFVPEPLGLCVVLASAIWWFSGKTAISPDVPIEQGSVGVQASVRRIPRGLQYAILFTLGTCFLIGVLISALSPSHRLQNKIAYSTETSGKSQSGFQMDTAQPPAPK
jgi:hypothetical protein